jgi:hypothetical protein
MDESESEQMRRDQPVEAFTSASELGGRSNPNSVSAQGGCTDTHNYAASSFSRRVVPDIAMAITARREDAVPRIVGRSR